MSTLHHGPSADEARPFAALAGHAPGGTWFPGSALPGTSRPVGERALRGAQVAYDPRAARPAVAWAEGTSPQGYRPVWLPAADLP